MHPCKTKTCGHGGTGQSHSSICSQYMSATNQNHAKLQQMSWISELYRFMFIYYLFNNDFNSSSYKASNHSPM